ncbi:hypothetical protein A2U01_0072654, partial [Trifolium medium]|nr:hypothetical protein [Trifolium medium]
MARCAPMLRNVWKLFCQLRVAQEWMTRRVSQLEDASGKLCQSRVAQERMARRASQLEGCIRKA